MCRSGDPAGRDALWLQGIFRWREDSPTYVVFLNTSPLPSSLNLIDVVLRSSPGCRSPVRELDGSQAGQLRWFAQTNHTSLGLDVTTTPRYGPGQLDSHLGPHAALTPTTPTRRAGAGAHHLSSGLVLRDCRTGRFAWSAPFCLFPSGYSAFFMPRVRSPLASTPLRRPAPLEASGDGC